MVRARSRIKTILTEQIRKISPEGAGNLTEAIRMGVQVLNNSKLAFLLTYIYHIYTALSCRGTYKA